MPLLNTRTANDRMSFMQHLEDLRWHIMRSLIAVLLGLVVMFFFIQDIVEKVILGPLSPDFITNRLACQLDPSLCMKQFPIGLQAIAPTEQFMRALTIAIFGGILLAFPYIVWEFWRFIKPGLLAREIRKVRGAVFYVSLLFFSGVLFTYFVVLPFMFRFFASFQLTTNIKIENNWQIGEIITLVVQFCAAGGLLFQLPIVAWVLAQLGLITAKFMRQYRRHAIVVSLVLSGVMTPSPDLLSQMLLALPMFFLYEISIFIVQRVQRQKERIRAEREAEWRADDAARGITPPAPDDDPDNDPDGTDGPDTPDDTPPPAPKGPANDGGGGVTPTPLDQYID